MRWSAALLSGVAVAVVTALFLAFPGGGGAGHHGAVPLFSLTLGSLRRSAFLEDDGREPATE